jgi:hypothetical protein
MIMIIYWHRLCLPKDAEKAIHAARLCQFWTKIIALNNKYNGNYTDCSSVSFLLF